VRLRRRARLVDDATSEVLATNAGVWQDHEILPILVHDWLHRAPTDDVADAALCTLVQQGGETFWDTGADMPAGGARLLARRARKLNAAGEVVAESWSAWQAHTIVATAVPQTLVAEAGSATATVPDGAIRAAGELVLIGQRATAGSSVLATASGVGPSRHASTGATASSSGADAEITATPVTIGAAAAFASASVLAELRLGPLTLLTEAIIGTAEATDAPARGLAARAVSEPAEAAAAAGSGSIEAGPLQLPAEGAGAVADAADAPAYGTGTIVAGGEPGTAPAAAEDAALVLVIPTDVTVSIDDVRLVPVLTVDALTLRPTSAP